MISQPNPSPLKGKMDIIASRGSPHGYTFTPVFHKEDIKNLHDWLTQQIDNYYGDEYVGQRDDIIRILREGFADVLNNQIPKESLEEHEKHCSFCQGAKEYTQAPKSEGKGENGTNLSAPPLTNGDRSPSNDKDVPSLSLCNEDFVHKNNSQKCKCGCYDYEHQFGTGFCRSCKEKNLCKTCYPDQCEKFEFVGAKTK